MISSRYHPSKIQSPISFVRQNLSSQTASNLRPNLRFARFAHQPLLVYRVADWRQWQIAGNIGKVIRLPPVIGTCDGGSHSTVLPPARQRQAPSRDATERRATSILEGSQDQRTCPTSLWLRTTRHRWTTERRQTATARSCDRASTPDRRAERTIARLWQGSAPCPALRK